jgi:hypothetical protein
MLCLIVSRHLLDDLNHIVMCRPIARKRGGKHVSVEIDSWKPSGYGTRILGYENESCRFLETNSVRDTFPCKRTFSKHFL